MEYKCPCGGCGSMAAPHEPVPVPYNESYLASDVRSLTIDTRRNQRLAIDELNKQRKIVHNLELEVKTLRSVYLTLTEASQGLPVGNKKEE